MGLQEIPLPPIAPAPRAITIDGKLDEWKAVSGYNYNPFSQVSSSAGDPAMESLVEQSALSQREALLRCQCACFWQSIGKTATPAAISGGQGEPGSRRARDSNCIY